MKRALRAGLLGIGLMGAASAEQDPTWLEPMPPFRIAGNLYYVGSKGLASYLVATPEGHILINSSLEASVPLLRSSVEQLGFDFREIEILLISHAHWDHCAGSARIRELTHARAMVMDADVDVVESGGERDFAYGALPEARFPSAKVDRVLRDGDEVKLGDTVLVAHKTAGHTKGCTTWTLKVKEGEQVYDAVIVGSANVNPGYRLVGGEAYPEMAADFERTFEVLKGLPCDLFLGAHGSYYGLEEKVARMQQGEPATFVDPDGYAAHVARQEQAFRAELARQKEAAAR